MRKLAFALVTISIGAAVYAGEVVYESEQPGGVPDFSDQTTPNIPEQTLVVDPTPEPSSNNPNTTTQTQTSQPPTQALDTQLQQHQKKLAELQQQLDQAQAILTSAQTSLDNAQKAQEAGETTIGGDQYLDANLIRHLQQNVADAQANYDAASEAYNNYRNSSN